MEEDLGTIYAPIKSEDGTRLRCYIQDGKYYMCIPNTDGDNFIEVSMAFYLVFRQAFKEVKE